MKKTGIKIVLIAAMIPFIVWVADLTYLYKGIANTYLKGKKKPSIDEYQIFDNRKVEAGNYQAWPISKHYNTSEISDTCLALLEEMQTIAYVVIKNDSIRIERYWEEFSMESHTNSFSMAKTIVSILAGIAIDEGHIKSVNQKVADFFPEYSKGLNEKLTIKHLLTMSSGMNFSESYSNPFAFPAKAYFGDDLKGLMQKYKVVEEPGIEFEYLSGNTQLLGIILAKATGMELSTYASIKLWSPIGAKNTAYWSLDTKDGMEKAYCCFNSNARDFARIGKLYLNNGAWGNRQLVSKAYVTESVNPADLVEKDTGDKLKKYGYSWWMTDYRGHHIFLAEGLNGQYVAVIPNENIILVRLGKRKLKEKVNGLPADLYTYIDHALSL
jgi:CubicO group peptidase (beta-lactamase class C family)